MTLDQLALVAVATLLVGSADFFGGVASRRSPPLTVAGWSQAIGVPILLVVAGIVGGSVIGIDLAYGALAGVGSAVGVAALYRGFAHSDVGIVAPVAATVAAVVPIVVGIAIGERPSAVAAVGLGIALVAIFLVGFVPGSDHAVSGVAHGVVSGLGFGVMVLGYAATSTDSGLWSAVSGRTMASVLLWIAILATRSDLRVVPDARRPTMLAGVLAAVGMGAFVTVSQTADLVVLGVVLGLFPVVTVVLAAIVLEERLRASQWIGVALAGVAVALINIG